MGLYERGGAPYVAYRIRKVSVRCHVRCYVRCLNGVYGVCTAHVRCHTVLCTVYDVRYLAEIIARAGSEAPCKSLHAVLYRGRFD